MSHFVFRPGGIPAVVSVPHKQRPWLCFLVVRVDARRQQATVELQFARRFAGFDVEQRISLVYDADQLADATLDHADAPPSPYVRQRIARNNGRDLRLLSLVAARPCTVRWARRLGDIAHGCDERFEQLADLARATTLHVLFDYAWLNPAKSAQFLSLVDASRQLVGFPVDESLFTEADWGVFVRAGATLEAPPPYEDASLKRPRQCTYSARSSASDGLTDMRSTPKLAASPGPKASPPRH